MKRMISFALALALCLCLLSVTAFAASASATLTGPDTVRAGDTITLSFKLNGSGLYGVSGTLSYDSSQLTLSATTQKIGNAWQVEWVGNKFVAYDNDLLSPINSNTTIFTVSFKVKSGLPTGTAVKVSVTDVVATDGNADSKVGTVSYSKTIAAPKSSDCTLKALTVSNATISPAFSSTTTSYTATVPFEVSKLDIAATANDSKASVKINSPNLTPGGTTKVSVTVTAENGSTKTYTIQVTRAQDPNYVASGNSDLSGITVNGFLLSPVFSSGNTNYIVWLPYETENVSVSGTAADSKASVEVVGGDLLIAGADNEIQVICTAEDGTQKVYTVVAKRAAAHGTEPSQPADPTPDPTPSEPAVTEPAATEPSDTQPVTTQPQTTVPQTQEPQDKTDGIALWVLMVVAVGCLAVGVVIGFTFGKKKK